MNARPVKKRSATWLITFADLMTLLVTFFVMIVSFSIQDETKMQVVAGSIREAFGVTRERRYAGEVNLDGVPDPRQPGAIIASTSPTGEALDETLAARPAAGMDGKRGAFEAAAADRRRYEAVRERIEHAILMRPIAKDANDAITVNLTETGLQVLIVDTDGRAMFEPGGAEPTPLAAALLEETARGAKAARQPPLHRGARRRDRRRRLFAVRPDGVARQRRAPHHGGRRPSRRPHRRRCGEGRRFSSVSGRSLRRRQPEDRDHARTGGAAVAGRPAVVAAAHRTLVTLNAGSAVNLISVSRMT